MALCLRHKKGDHPFHDYNTLQFVMIHEIAHIASISEGHNQEFINNFRFLLRQAKHLVIMNLLIIHITYKLLWY